MKRTRVERELPLLDLGLLVVHRVLVQAPLLLLGAGLLLPLLVLEVRLAELRGDRRRRRERLSRQQEQPPLR